MSTIVVDCETFPLISPAHRSALEAMAARAEKPLDDYVSLSTLLPQIVCVGLEKDDRRIGIVSLEQFPSFTDQAGHATERELLEQVNGILDSATSIVTYNGRGFDLPLLIGRSLASRVPVSKTLRRAAEENRHAFDVSYDVMDRLSFCGATKPSSLRAACIAILGRDPKTGGDGSQVKAIVEAGDVKRLVDYCCADVADTAELYRVVVEYLDRPEPKLDPEGKIVMREGVAVFAFGKHEGKQVASERKYCEWLLASDFPEETKAVIRGLLDQATKLPERLF